MQRLVSLGKAVPAVGAAVAGGATLRAQPVQQPQHGAGSSRGEASARLSMEEQEGFVHVGLQAQPVQQHEVSQAITQLAALGGVAVDQHQRPQQSSHAPAAAAPAGGPLIEEVFASPDGSESDASSEGSAANLLLASAEPHHYSFEPPFSAAGSEDGQEELSSFDLLSEAITNLLNDPAVMNAIEGRLSQDPAFVQLVHRSTPGVALPAPARMLLLEEFPASGASSESDFGDAEARGGGNPLLGLLSGIQRGAVVAAVHIGEAFCHLGNFIRGLGENLRTALAGMEGGRGGGGAAGDRPAHSIERAIFKVACVVAIMVVTKRVVALPRMAV